jgi:Cys-tRNA(Pro) deacylase
MAKKNQHVSETPATQWLKRCGVAYTEHPYAYVEQGGTAESARQLGVSEHAVIKTLVMQDDKAQPLVVLMHGDRQVSTKNLARELGVKSIEPCKPEVAQRHSGFLASSAKACGWWWKRLCSSCRAFASTAGGVGIWWASSRAC